MISAAVSYESKGRWHFIDQQAKVNGSYCTWRISCLSIWKTVVQFVFQQDKAPAHGAKLLQGWLASLDFIGKDAWLPNSSDLNPLDA